MTNLAPFAAGQIALRHDQRDFHAAPTPAVPVRSRTTAGPPPTPLQESMGTSPVVARLVRDVALIAPTDFTVVVSGETGSGKELVARAIHSQGRCASGPFVPVDCGALQPSLIESELFGHARGAYTGADQERAGKFTLANGGTLFLDEVQNLPPSIQAKFLRVLQERQVCPVGGSRYVPVNVRIVAASNDNLPRLVATGRFRADLYHRLNEFTIDVPALRDRGEDIPHLAHRFFDQTCQELGKQLAGFSAGALAALQNYGWPGNVRELRNVIRRAVLLAQTHITADHLGIAVASAADGGPAGESAAGEGEGEVDGTLSFKEMVRRRVNQAEREILLQVLRQTGGNKAKAARLLQIDYKTMRTKARQHGIPLSGVIPLPERA